MWRDALFGTRKEKATQWLFIDFDGGVASGKGKVGDGEREVVCVRRMQWDVELFCRMRWTTGIGTTVKHELNNAMHVLHNFLGFDINTTAFCLGQYSLRLLLLKTSMSESMHRTLVRTDKCNVRMQERKKEREREMMMGERRERERVRG